MPVSVNLADLGRRIRAARLSRRLTLEEVVSRTDFTISWLSKIENGLLAPSLEGLVRLAEVLECGIDHLVAGLAVPPRFTIDRKNAGWKPAGRDGRPGMAVEQLAAGWQRRAMVPVILHLSAAGQRRAAEHYEGQRFLHVIEGMVKLAYGDEPIVLAAGDSIYFDASLPHSIAPASRGSAKVLSVLYEPTRNGHPTRGGRAGKSR
jgi:transcriptional regulator with XRE-family HTH domain